MFILIKVSYLVGEKEDIPLFHPYFFLNKKYFYSNISRKILLYPIKK